MTTKAPTIAAIDVGTNSFHLVIASVNSRGMLQINCREKEVVRLGSSTDSKDMKYLQADAMMRGIKALKNYAALARSENAEIRAVATSAVREAINKEEFLNKVKSQIGINIEVVSGAEEGRLIYFGVLHALPILNRQTLMIDIGGGSTETIVGINGEIKHVHSAKLGAIRLSKHFFNDETTTDEQIHKCREFIKGEWYPILKKIHELGFEMVVGTAGTIYNIAAMALSAKDKAVPDLLNGISIKRRDLLAIINKIISAKTIKERSELPGIDQSRVDIILAGALILEHIIIALDIEKLTLSSYSLREGIVFDTVQKNKAIQEFKHLSHLRYETVRNICQQYQVEMPHAEHVKNIAMQMFDDLQPLHKLGYKYRELLEAAALLHDVGYHIAHDQHHMHSLYIITHCMMPGFTNDESELIGNIARYHRKSHPKRKHENYQVLTPEMKEIVRILSGILRIAEGIDRRQMQIVKEVKAEYNSESITIHLIPADSDKVPDIELWGANRRKLLLEESLAKNITIMISMK